MYVLIFLSLFTYNSASAQVETYEYQARSSKPIKIYTRHNIHSTQHIFTVNEQIKKGEIIVNKHQKNLSTSFILDSLAIGDKVIFDTTHKRDFKVIVDYTSKKKNFLFF